MIIVGLGNPGKQYDLTPHNAGFHVLDRFAEDQQAPAWKEESGVSWTKVGPTYLIKPLEFMNLSGVSLRKFLDYKKIPVVKQELYLIHDELDFPLGTWKVQLNRSNAGHHGVQSVIDVLGTQDFHRIRIGISPADQPIGDKESFVLHRLAADEQKILQEAVAQIVDHLKKITA